MKKRFLSLLLMLCMAVSFLSVTVSAQNISYVVAGTDTLFGTSWNFTEESGNVMTENNGKYELHLSPTEACGDVLFKVAKLTDNMVKNTDDYYGDASGNNIEINVSGGGDILIVFDPTTHEITVSGDKVTVKNQLQIDSMRVVGNGNGNWLHNSEWDAMSDDNLMTETSIGVYEIIYTNINAYDNYQFRFAANDTFDNCWGGKADSENAVYSGEDIRFAVKQDNSTIRIVLNLAKFDYMTRTGATYKIYVNNVQINVTDASCFEFDKQTGTIVRLLDDSITDVVIPDTIDGVAVTTLGEESFSAIQMKSITIPDSVTSIGKRAFARCSFKNITIPDSVTSIDEMAFVMNLFKNITLSNNITTIKTYTFQESYCLESITIPYGVTSIEKSAFDLCGNLVSVIIPSSVTYIEGALFPGNFVLDNVYYLGTETQWNTFKENLSDNEYNDRLKNNVKVINVTYDKDVSLIYDGEEKELYKAGSDDVEVNYYNVKGEKLSSPPKEMGTYTVKVSMGEDVTDIEIGKFIITKAYPTENPEKKTTAIVPRGSTLAKATVTEGEMLGIDGKTVLEGVFAWADDTKIISADGMEKMVFTPTDPKYAPITVDVAVSTYSSGGGSSTSRYTVKFDTNGGNTITSQTVKKNSTAAEPKAPTKDGYVFDGWYTDSKFTTEYDFDTKVTKNITLYAKWVEDEFQEPSDDNKDDEQKPSENEWKNPFTDVTKADWFFDNVRYANENGLMSGVTNTEFAPNLTLTRGMLVTIFYRLAGEPAVNKSVPFADVTAESYYVNAVIWAEQNGIVSGISETEFAPDENITREQIAVILYRYAKTMEYDVSVGENTNILSYTDFDEISEYAIEAMQYAVGSGLINGKTETTFNPKDNATRAEIAAILNRFIESNK